MHGVLAEFLHYLQNAARYKWLSIVFGWAICLGGWIFVSQMPDVFTATTRVHVDTRSILLPLLQGMTIQPDVSSQIKLMTRLIFSRPNIEKIARMTDLDLEAKDEKSMEKLVLQMQSSLSISGGENNLFNLAYTDPDPKVAKKVVQAVLTLFVEQSLGESREDSDAAQKFLEQQIKEHELRLQASEQAREEYKRANYALMTADNDLYGQLNKLVAQKEEAKLLVQEAMQRRDEIQRQLQNEEPMVSNSESEATVTNAMDLRIQNLQAKLDDLLLRYTDKHPAVVALKKSIVDLTKQRKHELEAEGEHMDNPNMGGKGMEANPIYQQLKIALGEADANSASLAAREKAYDGKIELLKQQMDERLKVETHLQGLNRDYETVKTNYNELLKKRETARMSGTVEQTTDAVKFRIVDPPQVPSKPSAPNRILLYSGVLIGAIVFGLSLAIIMTFIRPSFGTINGLREVTGVAVLGSISMNWIPELRRKKRNEMIKFIFIIVILIILYISIILLEIKGINLWHLPF
jgi:polysaccharide chain length determinant protein (PEP-CTERM system associated)